MRPVLPWIEASVAGAIMLVFVLSAVLLFKDEHVEHHPLRVYIGAALQGLIIGVLVGFVILPLRFAFFVPDPDLFAEASRSPPRGIASLSLLPVLVLLLVVRRGLLARAPLIGRYLRAYRRAALKHQIDGAGRALARLEAIDERVAARRS